MLRLRPAPDASATWFGRKSGVSWFRHLVASAPVALLPAVSLAQAWLPAQGEATLSMSYEHYDGGDHLFSSDAVDGLSSRGYVAQGDRWFLGDTYGHTVHASLDVGILDRLAATASLAWVGTKYVGRSPVGSDDDGRLHGSVQDILLTLHYQVLERPLALATSLGALVPVGDYDTSGHATQGRGLHELQVRLQAGRLLRPLLPSTYVHAAIVHAFAENIEGFGLDRTGVDLEAGHFLTSSWTVRAMSVLRWTHDGRDWISRTDSGGVGIHAGGGTTSLHIRTADADYARVGGGVSFAMTPSLALFAAGFTTVAGKNVDDADIVIIGSSWSFATPWSYDW